MGTFFLQDDYRLPDIANALGPAVNKKDNTASSSGNSSSQGGIFENNPCFASIKKELGFLDDTSCGELDDYAETRARSSPVVERLILQEIQSDIAEYAASIGVSHDPEQWSVAETRKWLQWVANIYQLGDLSDCLSYNGVTLCNFSEQEFILLTGSEDTGLKIAAQLDLWKNAMRLTPSAGFYHFQQQQVMDYKFGTPQGRTDASTPKLLAASCSWSTTSQTQTEASMTPAHSYNNASNMTNFSAYHSPYQPYAQNSLSCSTAPARFPHEEIRYPPRPTIPLDRFGSYRAACQSDNFSAAQSYQRYTSMGRPNTPNMMYGNQQKTQFNFNSKDSNYADHNKLFEESVRDVPKEYIDSLMGQKTYTVDPKESLKALAILSKPVETEMPAVKLQSEIKTEISEACSGVAEQSRVVKQEIGKEPIASGEEPSTSDEQQVKTQKRKSSKHPIHLWEFLKQLLSEGKDCIRWIDQEKGIFKIHNSQQVAKFWGERKNRPAMNYDKLSRSIRQYYKKGIIKKTTTGKRLVYQFCDGYL